MTKELKPGWWVIDKAKAKAFAHIPARIEKPRKLEDYDVFRSEENYESLSDIPNFVSISALAKKLSLSTSLLRQDIRNGTLPAEKVGKQYRIDPRNVKSYLTMKRALLLKKSA